VPDAIRPKKTVKVTQRSIRAARALEAVPHPGLSFSPKHYLFIARAKRGELWALNHSSSGARGRVTPLFEIGPPAKPRKKKGASGPTKPAKTLHAHAADVLAMIRDEWGQLPLFMDTRYVPEGGIPSPLSVKTIFDIARTMQLNIVPVTSFKFSPDYQSAIRDIVAHDNRGVMIRISFAELTSLGLLKELLPAILGVLNVTPKQTDILIDLGFRREQIEVQTLGEAALTALPQLNEWRTVTLGAGCFPESISTLDHEKWYTVKRSDWLGWSFINAQRTNRGVRVPSYGDYGVRCGGAPRDIPNRPDPNIRYSDSEIVLVRKERKVDGKTKLICSSLVKRSEFRGAAFSKGDEQIAARAAMTGSPNNGQAEQWIQWCSNHHLELTALQIQNLP
jgi:hypothetical protein